MREKRRQKGDGTGNHQVGSQKLGAARRETAGDRTGSAAVEQWNHRRLILFSL